MLPFLVILGRHGVHSRGRTIPEAAIEVLSARKRPLLNSEITRELVAGGMRLRSGNPSNTVGSVLSRRSRNVGDIVRVGRGCWALRTWGHSEKD
ncbi:winged helix-turn-helix domain-containing protein [Dongia sp.]|uniref:winged helix-turn-helix domain-containing protein n=1 Tax=Dongia sp. TaxID=1977262 RepID=UPI003752E9D1